MISRILMYSIAVLVFASCASAPRYGIATPPKVKKSSRAALKKNKSKSKAVFIDPKTVNTNVKHKKKMVGVSSFYAEDFHGKLTANGEIYNQHSLTAAHKTFPLNTKIRVTNLDRLTKPSVILKVNDRGPYVGDRILDCSSKAAKKLGFFEQGTANVKIEVLKWGDNKYYKEWFIDENW